VSTAGRPLSIALGQITGRPYAAAEDREHALATARRAFDRGAGLVVLPELIVPGYVADRARLEPFAEPLDGPTTRAWRDLAAEAGGFIAGGFCEREGDRLYNTAVLVGPDGVALHYRKLHLFREEKLAFAPGDLGLPVVELPFGTVGMCVCYDLRFVETVRLMALTGAELILVPTAWAPGFDAVRWDERGMAPQANGALLQANLSQVFIACASQAGTAEMPDLLGSSILATPFGKLVAGPLPGTEEAMAVVEIDLEDSVRAQVRDPLIRPREDRRTDVYELAPARPSSSAAGVAAVRSSPRSAAGTKSSATAWSSHASSRSK
jgi:predicted amidohydrolase